MQFRVQVNWRLGQDSAYGGAGEGLMDKEVGWRIRILSFSLFVSACSQTIPTVPTPRFIAWSQVDPTTPKRICVLPFADKAKVPGITNQVRQSFAGHLSIKHFADTELYDIDSRLETLGSGWQTTSAQDLGRTLGCNALVYGEVTRANRLYLALYSQLTLEGGIHLVDTETGQTLVKETYATKFRSAGFPLSPLAIIPDALKNLNNLSDAQMIRAVDDLGRNLASKVPDLPALPTYSSTASVPSAPPHAERPSTSQIPASPLMVAEKKKLPSARTVAQPEASTFDVPLPTTPLNTKNAPSVTVNAPTAISPSMQGEGYRLQVAALRTPVEAQRVVHLLRSKGYEPIVAQSVGTKPIWHRVVLGPFPSIHTAQEVGAQINKSLQLSPVVINQSRP